MGRSGRLVLNFGPRRLHFEPVGVFKEVGYKFGRYWDVAWMQKPVPRAGVRRPSLGEVPPSMSNHAGFSVRKRIESFGYAIRGMATLLSSQPNAWIHAAATLAVVCLALTLRLDRLEWALLVTSIAIVWAAEAFNSALEWLCDVASPEQHPLVEKAKDVAAAAVLIASIAAAIVGCLVMGPPLWAALSG